MKNNRLFTKCLFTFLLIGIGLAQVSAQYTVKGTVKNLEGLPVADVSVIYNGQTKAQTDRNGSYTFTVSSDDQLPISLQYSEADYNGINTGDIISIRNHILTKKPFTSPYQLIAADTDRSGQISGQDIVNVSRIILGKIKTFPQEHIYRFLPAGFVPDLNNWNNIPHTVTTDFSAGNTFTADFTAIKLGDPAH